MDREELLRRYTAGERDFPGIGLRETGLPFSSNLSNLDLNGIKLIGADLSSIDLVNTQLIGANLIGADLEGVYAIGSNMSNATLIGADISEWGYLHKPSKRGISEKQSLTYNWIYSKVMAVQKYLRRKSRHRINL